MELPQRPSFGAEGGRKPTHDFLSLYTSHSTTSLQDVSPRPPSHQPQGGYLKTHDFLQPLERGGGGPPCAAVAKEEGEGEGEGEQATSVEHTLPGGIGTYTINHVSYLNPQPPQTTTTVVDTNDETSNSTCYTGTGSGFTLWDESALNKGKTGKENKNMTHTSNALLIGKQTEARPSMNYHSNHFSSLSPPQAAGHKRKSFMEMMKSTKVDEDLDDEEDFILKKESPGKADLNVRVDGKSCDQKVNTPRSKHSATEQRRRSKINDRFHMLREIIPHSDQKRDKASFLLEVIEYIQFLHDKVHKYEQGSYQGWSLEAAKLVQWRSNNRSAESYVDQSRVTNGDANSSGLQYAHPKLDDKNASISATIPGLGAQKPADSDTSSATTPKAMNHHSGIPNKAMPFPMSLQTNPLNPVIGTSAQPSLEVKTNINSVTTQQQSQPEPGHFRPNGFVHADDHLKDQDLNVEGGTISISSAYSRGLLSNLTEALRSSGVDLSQASISVQIEVGKGSNMASSSIAKDNESEVLFSNQGKTTQVLKKPKTKS